jgi:hypothetical protein
MLLRTLLVGLLCCGYKVQAQSLTPSGFEAWSVPIEKRGFSLAVLLGMPGAERLSW